MDANDLTEVVSSVRLPAAAMAGRAGRGPGTLESEVEVIASDAEVSPDDPGGEKPVPAMIALAVETRKVRPCGSNSQRINCLVLCLEFPAAGSSQECSNEPQSVRTPTHT